MVEHPPQQPETAADHLVEQARVALGLPPQSQEWFHYRRGTQRQDAIPWGVAKVRVTGTHLLEDYALDNGGEEPFWDGDEHPVLGVYKFDALKRVQIDNTVESIGYMAFHLCRNLVQVVISSDDAKLVKIESWAFSDCQSLRDITLPSSLTTMGHSVFHRCLSLTSMDLSHCPRLTEIPNQTFRGCKSLKSVQLPPNLESIGGEAFLECTLLETIVFPKTLQVIGGCGFAKCHNLTTIRFESMNAILTPEILHNSPFCHDCGSLQYIVLTERHDTLGKAEWLDLLHRVFLGRNQGGSSGGILGPDSTEEQRLGSIFNFLRPRMSKLLER
eukprot:CAMPEP_0168777900 /NCGR_PEP_ID=MMETSP0725-20121227/6814_1 /TAXON_ID=265536 /ORGANISM="Amphiprora sp., Strain CCMP467" /LENGTH=328 /DNA_ID=CAMNT_0008827671 /DNA_START=119 /DNA_END=1105 /DNA_ORIENTATION=+